MQNSWDCVDRSIRPGQSPHKCSAKIPDADHSPTRLLDRGERRHPTRSQPARDQARPARILPPHDPGGRAIPNPNKLLLIDTDDARRKSRVLLLVGAGYAVDLRDDYIEAERLDHEGNFDLIIVSLHGRSDKAREYSDQLSRAKPRLPILLLTDSGIYVPPGTLGTSLESGDPEKLITKIASMLVGSTHIRALPI